MSSIPKSIVEQVRFESEFVKQTFDNSFKELLYFNRSITEKVTNILYHLCTSDSKFSLKRPFNIVVRWIEPGGPVTGPADGLGDLSNAVKTAKMLEKEFPSAKIFLTNKFYDAEETFTSKEGEKLTETLRISDKISELLLGVFSPLSLPKYLKKYYPELPTILFDVATPDTTIWPFKEKHIGSEKLNLLGCYHIDEYNGQRTANDGFDGDSEHNWFSEGIGIDQRCHSSVGIHLDPTLSDSQLSIVDILPSLENQEVRAWLNGPFLEPNPGKREFYFGYSSSDDPGQFGRFINTVLEYENRDGNSGDVDIFLLTKERNFFRGWWSENFCPDWKDSTFGSLVLDEKKGEFERLCLNPKAYRTVRVLQWQGQLPHHDTRLLMQASGRVILVTGDQSWAEAVSLKNRIILYETRKWKKYLAKNMKWLAQYKFGEDSKIYQYFEYMFDAGKADWGRTWVSRLFAKYLDDPAFLQQHRMFMEMLHEKYNNEQWLFGMIKRQIAIHDAPLLEIEEKTFRKNIKRGAFDLAEKDVPLLTKQIQQAFQKSAKVKRERIDAQHEITAVISPFRRELTVKVKNLFGDTIPQAPQGEVAAVVKAAAPPKISTKKKRKVE